MIQAVAVRAATAAAATAAASCLTLREPLVVQIHKVSITCSPAHGHMYAERHIHVSLCAEKYVIRAL